MSIFLMVLVVAFSVILCIVEIPKMWKSKEYKDLIVFCVILCFGMIIGILTILDIDVANPADFVAAVFSPAVSLFKGALE